MKPTCCCPLRTGLKLIALIDFLVSISGILTSIGAFLYYELFTEEVSKFLENPPPQIKIFLNLSVLDGTLMHILLGFSLAYWVQKLVLGIILLFGIFKEKCSLMRIWIIWTLILLVFSIFSFLSVICLGVFEPHSIPFYIAAFLLREYTIWAAYTFLKRIQFSRESYPAFANDKITYKL